MSDNDIVALRIIILGVVMMITSWVVGRWWVFPYGRRIARDMKRQGFHVGVLESTSSIHGRWLETWDKPNGPIAMLRKTVEDSRNAR